MGACVAVVLRTNRDTRGIQGHTTPQHLGLEAVSEETSPPASALTAVADSSTKRGCVGAMFFGELDFGDELAIPIVDASMLSRSEDTGLSHSPAYSNSHLPDGF